MDQYHLFNRYEVIKEIDNKNKFKYNIDKDFY